MNWRTIIVCLTIGLAGCAQSFSPSTPFVAPTQFSMGQGPDAAADMADIYNRICLQAFPDMNAVQAALQPFNASPLSFAEISTILHADPGRGWRVSTASAPYVLTIEDPPYNTCAIRRMTRVGFPTAMPYIAAMKAYAASKSLLIGSPQRLQHQTPNGATVMMWGSPLVAPGSSTPRESSMYISTNYHGRFDPAKTPEATGGVGMEIRMAHQIMVPHP